jgi:hypothetical protein
MAAIVMKSTRGARRQAEKSELEQRTREWKSHADEFTGGSVEKECYADI